MRAASENGDLRCAKIRRRMTDMNFIVRMFYIVLMKEYIWLAGEYGERGDYFDDYQYDYGYDYNSYVAKDDLLRYDYNSNYDYPHHGPAYNFSIHHPGTSIQCLNSRG